MLPDGWAKARGANRGMAEVAGEGDDILPAKAVPDGEAMEFRGGVTYSGDTARREGGRRADEPIKKWYLAGGWGKARVGKEGGVPAAFASLVSGI